MDEKKLEQEIQDKGLTAARITPEQIDALIVSEAYHVFEGTMTTICCLKLSNGFNVIGDSSCVSAENFDAGIGRERARDKARDQVWMLEGYVLANTLTITRGRVTNPA